MKWGEAQGSWENNVMKNYSNNFKFLSNNKFYWTDLILLKTNLELPEYHVQEIRQNTVAIHNFISVNILTFL